EDKIEIIAVVICHSFIGQTHKRGVADGALARLHDTLVFARRQKDQREAPLVVHAPAHLLEAELVAVEVERTVEIAHPQHGMKIAHGYLRRAAAAAGIQETIYDRRRSRDSYCTAHGSH